MKLKLFVDHCVPMSLFSNLNPEKIEIMILKHFISPNSSDFIALKKANELKAILVSLDNDFSNILMYPPEKYSGIIAIKLLNNPGLIPFLSVQLIKLFDLYPSDNFYKGKLITVYPTQIKIFG